jgi:hypothetical protein
MRALILAAAVAVVCTSFAGAAEVKKETTKAPVVAGKAMTDTDMDKVTAGAGQGPDHTVYLPNSTAYDHANNANWRNQSFGGRAANLTAY